MEKLGDQKCLPRTVGEKMSHGSRNAQFFGRKYLDSGSEGGIMIRSKIVGMLD